MRKHVYTNVFMKHTRASVIRCTCPAAYSLRVSRSHLGLNFSNAQRASQIVCKCPTVQFMRSHAQRATSMSTTSILERKIPKKTWRHKTGHQHQHTNARVRCACWPCSSSQRKLETASMRAKWPAKKRCCKNENCGQKRRCSARRRSAWRWQTGRRRWRRCRPCCLSSSVLFTR